MRTPNKAQHARSAARIYAVQALYQMDLAGTELAHVIDQFNAFRMNLPETAAADEDEPALPKADRTFFAEIVRGVVRRQMDIDPVVDQQLAAGWRLARVDSTVRAILRAAMFELIDRPDIPARVIINEYIEVAHAFFDGEEPRVVNGVLDHLARRYRPDEFEQTGGAGEGAGAR